MNTENNSIFDGWIIRQKIYENEEYETYLVTKNTASGPQVRHLRVMHVKTEQFTADGEQYPPKIRKIVNSVELMQKLINCKNIVKFYNYRVVDRGEGVYTLVVLTDPLTPLKEKYDVEDMPIAEALKIVSAVCGAVEDYRRMGITDRKIIPENIFVTPEGDIKLGDFGILSTYIPEEDYISPEEYSVSGSAKQTDIYALGMLMFKLLNHDRAPFLPAYPTEITAENRSNAFKRRMNGEVPTAPEGAPDGIAPIISKVCAFEPSDRYSSLSVLKNDIDSVIADIDPLYSVSKPAVSGYNFEQTVLRETEPEPETEPEDIPVDDDYDESDYIPDTSRESRNIIIGFIVAIAVIVAFTVGFIVYTISKKPKNEPTTESTTVSTTSETVSTTEETTEETTTEESTTEETTTEPTTEETTTEPTTTEPTTTEPTTTEPTTEETSASVITSPASAYINVSGATAETYSDGERVDEILITIPVSFGSSVHSKDSIVLYTYDSDGKIIKTDSVDFSCYYSDESSKNTVCDIYLPDDVNVDTETYTYRLAFGRGAISGSLGSNNAFTVEIS